MGKNKSTFNNNVTAILLLIPAFVFIGLVFVYPIFTAIRLSLHTSKIFKFGNMGPASFDNYKDIFTNFDFWIATKNSFIYMFGTTFSSLILGFAFALGLNRLGSGKRILRTLYGFPWVIPPSIAALAWKWIFDSQSGILNQLLYKYLGVTVNWLMNPNVAMISLIISGIWHEFPYFMITTTAGLQMVNIDLLDAASIDGANSWHKFKYIIIPSVLQILGIATIMSCLTSFREYDNIAILTNGGPSGSTETLSIMIYRNAFQYFRMSSAAAIGLVSFMICIVLVFAFLRKTVKDFEE